MNKIRKLLALWVFLFFAGCGGGGSSVCEFVFSGITNGASFSNPDGSFWACLDSTHTAFDLVLFKDGTGGVNTIGTFTWEETGCGSAHLKTSVGDIDATDLGGSQQKGVFTGHLDATTAGLQGDFSCGLSQGVTSPTQTPQTPPAAQAPQGSGTNGEVLQDPKSSQTFLVIFAQDNQFLGFINDNPFDSNSICDAFGPYGSKFSSTSIWNSQGTYGSDVAVYSAFNNITSTPPIYYELASDGTLSPVAYITLNDLLSPRVDPYYLLGLLNQAGCGVSR